MNATIEAVKKITENKRRMPEVRDCSGLKVGDVARQGDIYIEKISDTFVDNVGLEKTNLQLVNGNTIGSSHCLVENPHAKLFETKKRPLSKNGKILRFPMCEIFSTTSFSISHRNHAWHSNFSAGHYVISQQCDFISQRANKD